MLDTIPSIQASWVGTLISYVVLVFLYYFLFATISMVLNHAVLKTHLLTPGQSPAKPRIRFIVYASLFFGLNASLYAFGLYDSPSDPIFLSLLTLIMSGLVVQIIEVMTSGMGAATDFYNTLTSFFITVTFLSPTAHLVRLDTVSKVYLLTSLLITFVLFSLGFVGTLAKKLSDKIIKSLVMENPKMRRNRLGVPWFLVVIILLTIFYLLWKAGYFGTP